ncbi:ABC transporter ATP-binding protein [Sphaerisporangium krabiense]|uniref:Putative ABC transport system ATP-binding protein n=1 Tax=Sphaerisporangium krabiense TaxID=763782 RepID=A0A7W8YZ28_9ACTN|nr:ABC transporter ATP-binding protein [Sphaerisporangium krabiense]MBB5624454.1 putative ABC transport system ATP-binding protein [Sphaerisporangium krabiense]GII61589.1 ABC transporter ATP-binding protein [Sphaerisporangium krabiense]
MIEPVSPAEEPSAAVPVVRAVNLVKIYQTGGLPVPAVRGVDLRVEPGEFVAVMGPSGSGKSTLVHMLGGLDTRTSGEIWVDGERADTLTESGWAILRRRKIGFVFQFFNLVANMTVADNVELPALLGGSSPRHARERREYLLGELGLSGKADASPAQLSGGEQQRVALARALANQPRLLLADEPTGNLDSRNTRDVLRLLGEVHRQGQTIVMVTHDARVAALADRLITLLDGEIADDGAIASPRRPKPDPDHGPGKVIELRG